MQMTIWEIQNSYRTAKNKEKQIGILAELNDCSIKDIKKILDIDKKPVEEKPKEIAGEDIISKLFERLEVLDKEIKDKEEEYRKISIAIEVLENLRKEDYERIIQQ